LGKLAALFRLHWLFNIISQRVFIAVSQVLTALRCRLGLADETMAKLMFLRSVFGSGNDYCDFGEWKGCSGPFGCFKTV